MHELMKNIDSTEMIMNMYSHSIKEAIINIWAKTVQTTYRLSILCPICMYKGKET